MLIRRYFRLAALLLVATPSLHALPNSVVGGLFNSPSPLDGKELTDDLLARAAWDGDTELPGDWRDEGSVAGAEVSHLLARPKLFGRDVILLRATHRDGRLASLEATYADAGSFFGYFDQKLPEGLTRRQARAEVTRRVLGRQAEFAQLYGETLGDLRSSLARAAEGKRPDENRLGHNRHLRIESEDYRHDDFTLRLLAADQRLIRVQVFRSTEVPRTWLDPSLTGLERRERLDRLAKTVETRADGTVELASLRPIPQGYQPYCGLNSLAMAARHLGLHLDEDWLAVAAGFRNTGSADGSNLPRVYHAVAAEAGISLDRSTRFDANAARRALAAGLPVVVWRRFSNERNQLHTNFARRYSRDPGATLPDPTEPAERATWPDDDSPLHASVLTGYHDERREFLFLESWSASAKPRRMRAEELEATAYLTFVFEG